MKNESEGRVENESPAPEDSKQCPLLQEVRKAYARRPRATSPLLELERIRAESLCGQSKTVN